MHISRSLVIVALCSISGFSGLVCAKSSAVPSTLATSSIRRSVASSATSLYSGKHTATGTPTSGVGANEKDPKYAPSKDAAELRKKVQDTPEPSGGTGTPKSCPAPSASAQPSKRALLTRDAYSEHSRRATRYRDELDQARQRQRTAAAALNANIDELNRLDQLLQDHADARIHLTYDERDRIYRDKNRLEDRNRQLRRDYRAAKNRVKRKAQEVVVEVCWLSNYFQMRHRNAPAEIATMIANYANYQALADQDPDR